jgi:hypothetical protein
LAPHQTPTQREASVVNEPYSINREAGFRPGLNRWRETFSLNRSLSSPQQPLANYLAFYK